MERQETDVEVARLVHPAASPAGCHCLAAQDDQRYLTSFGRPDCQPGTPAALEASPAMLHVLVTRPAIAKKPRDNIIFEGDMDLKTTFETSYEALARMRLEYWKKYQQFRCQSGQSAAPSPAHNLLADGTANGDGAAPQVPVNPSVSLSPHRLMSGAKADQPVDRPAPPPEDSRATGECRAATENGTADCCSARQGDRPAPPGATVTGVAVAPVQAGEIGSQKIDCDLSPIIVFDSNLNRLETVGTRKRSKHRPSTSLRAGARGLFGDQDMEVGGSNGVAHRSQAGVSDSKSAVKNLGEQQRLALDARNLNSASQPDKLVFSDSNIIVNSRRRVWDNVNMEDHIKNQNIVAVSDPPSQSSIWHEQENLDMEGSRRREVAGVEDENLRITRQEEAEAVEELQKLMTPPGELDVTDGPARLAQDLVLDQTKLRRSCQNQSFDISLNDYPKVKLCTSAQAGAQTASIDQNVRATSTSRHNRKYNDLFRESPEFSLMADFDRTFVCTPNSTLDTKMEQNQPRTSLDQVKQNLPEAELKGSDPVPTESECKVTSIADHYCYIGSIQGHKYYVENVD